MTCGLRLLDAAPGASIQDLGRSGYRAMGVPVAGAIDTFSLRLGNALLDNPENAAALELTVTGMHLRCEGRPVRLSLAGQISGHIIDPQGLVNPLAAYRTACLRPGESLRLKPPADGIAYLCVEGGLLCVPQLGSRATYFRAGIGGLHGQALTTGDFLPCRPAENRPYELSQNAPPCAVNAPIHVIPGPQWQAFTPDAQSSFLASDYFVTHERDRMGMRLSGPALRHNGGCADILSDGTVAGAIQVPANGQPIILLADAQTTGGYPKIATVISADLPRLPHLRGGQSIRFVAVDLSEARELLREADAAIRHWQSGRRRVSPPNTPNLDLLQAGNLVSGVVRGDESTAGS